MNIEPLRAVLPPLGALPPAVEQLASHAQYPKGGTICHQDDPAEYGYRIMAGAARECALMADGRRQVIDFLMPGDVFGFWSREAHRFTGETITDKTTVARYPRRRITRLAESEPDVAREMHQLALEAIDRLQRRMALLAKASALERVSGFLLQMAARSKADGKTCIAFPMSRYDIADYLALAVETVSRTLTTLRLRHVIVFTAARSLRIVDGRMLEWCSEHRDL